MGGDFKKKLKNVKNKKIKSPLPRPRPRTAAIGRSVANGAAGDPAGPRSFDKTRIEPVRSERSLALLPCEEFS